MADQVYRVIVAEGSYELQDSNSISLNNAGMVQAMMNDMQGRGYLFAGMVPLSGGREGFVFHLAPHRSSSSPTPGALEV